MRVEMRLWYHHVAPVSVAGHANASASVTANDRHAPLRCLPTHHRSTVVTFRPSLTGGKQDRSRGLRTNTVL